MENPIKSYQHRWFAGSPILRNLHILRKRVMSRDNQWYEITRRSPFLGWSSTGYSNTPQIRGRYSWLQKTVDPLRCWWFGLQIIHVFLAQKNHQKSSSISPISAQNAAEWPSRWRPSGMASLLVTSWSWLHGFYLFAESYSCIACVTAFWPNWIGGPLMIFATSWWLPSVLAIIYGALVLSSVYKTFIDEAKG